MNIILITIDCLRADYCGWLNSKSKELTPFLNKLAEESIVFTRAYAAGPATAFAFPGILTGTYPLSFKGWDGKEFPALNQRPYLPSILQNNGYFTVAVHSNAFLSSFFGYHQGFDIFEDIREDYKEFFNREKYLNFVNKFFIKLNKSKQYISLRDIIFKKIPKLYQFLASFINFIKVIIIRKTTSVDSLPTLAKEMNEFVFEKISNFKNPWFLFLHYTDLHEPYFLPKGIIPDKVLDKKIKIANFQYMFGKKTEKENQELLKKLYQKNIQYLDRQLENLFDQLEDEFKNSIIIITADHGQEFGEYGGSGHFPNEKESKLYKEILHVPLLIKVPNHKIKTINKIVSHTQIPATILKLIGMNPPSEMNNSFFNNKKIKVYSECLLKFSPVFDYFDLSTIKRIEIKDNTFKN